MKRLNFFLLISIIFSSILAVNLIEQVSYHKNITNKSDNLRVSSQTNFTSSVALQDSFSTFECSPWICSQESCFVRATFDITIFYDFLDIAVRYLYDSGTQYGNFSVQTRVDVFENGNLINSSAIVPSTNLIISPYNDSIFQFHFEYIYRYLTCTDGCTEIVMTEKSGSETSGKINFNEFFYPNPPESNPGIPGYLFVDIIFVLILISGVLYKKILKNSKYPL